MTDKLTYVFIELNGENHLVGRLWSHFRSGHESASFEYDDSWLKRSDRFALEPLLEPHKIIYHTPANKKIFGALGDSAPDRWGRLLMKRNESIKALVENRPTATLNEIDYLLLVNDEAREGALRFKSSLEGDFLAPAAAKPIPPLVNLSALLSASERIVEDRENTKDLALLLAPGSSLGGARPKASVRDINGDLCIAKFPKKDDNNNIVLWEAVALTLAKKAGIRTPSWTLKTIAKKAVIILKRFDRNGLNRIPFLSAMSMLGANDNDSQVYSYLEIAAAISMYGSAPDNDLEELWRRIIFSILISNTDDHLRNHGFLYESTNGWRLSPLYDVNPSNDQTGILHTNINEDNNSASIGLALSVANYFRLDCAKAKNIIKEVLSAVNQWKVVAKSLRLSQAEIQRMVVAFEHSEHAKASKL